MGRKAWLREHPLTSTQSWAFLWCPSPWWPCQTPSWTGHGSPGTGTAAPGEGQLLPFLPRWQHFWWMLTPCMDELCKLSHIESQHLSYSAWSGFQLDCRLYLPLDWGFSTLAGSAFPSLLLWGVCAKLWNTDTHPQKRWFRSSFWHQRWCKQMPEWQKTDSFSLNFHCTALVLHHIHITVIL